MRVDDDPKVGDQVFDFLALIKRLSAVNFIGDISFPERFFKDTRLRIGAVEHGKMGVGAPFVHPQFENLRSDQIPFFIVRICRKDAYFAARLVFGVDMLGDLPFIFADKAVGRIDDVLRRTIVPFQFEQAIVGVLIFETQHIVDVGSAKRVDTLGIVADYADAPVFLAQTRHDQVLREIRILILVYQHIAEQFLIFFQHLPMVAKQQIRL